MRGWRIPRQLPDRGARAWAFRSCCRTCRRFRCRSWGRTTWPVPGRERGFRSCCRTCRCWRRRRSTSTHRRLQQLRQPQTRAVCARRRVDLLVRCEEHRQVLLQLRPAQARRRRRLGLPVRPAQHRRILQQLRHEAPVRRLVSATRETMRKLDGGARISCGRRFLRVGALRQRCAAHGAWAVVEARLGSNRLLRNA